MVAPINCTICSPDQRRTSRPDSCKAGEKFVRLADT